MRRLVLAPEAATEFRAVLRHSRTAFGPIVRNRYRLLIERAFVDLCADPDRPGVKSLGDGRHLYHVRHSLGRIPTADRIRSPRHIVAFRHDEATVEVVRLLYDGMDLPTRLK